jgi:predicted acyl esterase
MLKQVDWRSKLSVPKYAVGEWRRDVPIRTRAGLTIYADVLLPRRAGRWPALMSMSAYGKDVQHLPIPVGGVSDYSRGTGGIESGLSSYFVSRGYAHVIVDPRGVGRSDGKYDMLGPGEQSDGYDAVEWIAGESWCDGRVGMLGMSYFACMQYLVAAQRPPHLKAIFAHDGWTDFYRHNYFHGGILNWGKAHHIWRLYDSSTTETITSRSVSAEEYARRIAALRADPDIMAYPYLWKLTNNAQNNPMLLDLLLNPLDGPFYWERSPCRMYDRIEVPTFLLSRWSAWAIHLPGAIDAFERLSVPKRLVVTETKWEGGFGRPWFENHDLVLAWYDYWLRDIDNGIMDTSHVKTWLGGADMWKELDAWPPKNIGWRKFYLRARQSLATSPSSRGESSAVFESDPGAPADRAAPCVTYRTNDLEADVAVAGPLALHFWGTLDAEDANWFAIVSDVAPNGRRRTVTKGWLKASHRALDSDRATEMRPYHLHTRIDRVTPNEPTRYAIDLRDTAHVFRKGHRLELRIRGQSSPWEDFPIWFHLNRSRKIRQTVLSGKERESYLLVPVLERWEEDLIPGTPAQVP